VEDPPIYDEQGNATYYLSSRVPLYDDKHEEVIGIVGISVDITAQKKQEEELRVAKEAAEAASKAKTEFLANMSHDIRTPLTGVIGLSEMLENSLADPKQKEDAHLLHESGQELLNMLNGILNDVQSGKVSHNLHSETFNLYECIYDLVKLEKPTTTLKNLGLFVNIETSVPQWIVSDRKKIQRIILNLLGNAIKFTKTGHITIDIKCLEKKGKKVHLQIGVSDTGIGIPKKLQKKVFDRFFKVNSSSKGLYQGNGLGLHIVQSYVNLLGGHITLTSEEGVGTTFHFDLSCKLGREAEIQKVLSKKPQDAKSVMTESPKNIDGTVPTLLLVEDNITALRVLEALVVKAGCQFYSVLNGEEAFEIFKSRTFDLIITDIGLPGISGEELAVKIREWEKINSRSSLPIIGLTGHVQPSDHENFLNAGITAILEKPTNAALIQQTVKNYIMVPSNKNTTDHLDKPLKAKDLPQCEGELFTLDNFPIFDEQQALEQLNDAALLKELIKDFISNIAQKDLHDLQKAYDNKDW
ncbi:MAG: response regulator, partial [Silvanigrellaceae bacterium]|nr:response regulator [Silvanigrellaceae bacterium]